MSKPTKFGPKAVIIWIIKAAIAFVLAFALLCAFCLIYYNTQIHTTDKAGASDFVWEKSKPTIRATEGLAWTYTDEYGYTNSWQGEGAPSILVLGSSHTEGFNVNWDENYVYQLSSILSQNEGATSNMWAYNMGASEHGFVNCAQNLEAALDKCTNVIGEGTAPKYVVIETSSIMFRSERLEKTIEGTLPEISSDDSGIKYYLQKVPYFKLLSYQYANLKSANVDDINNSAGYNYAEQNMDEYAVSLDALFGKMADTCAKYGAKLIILYQPTFVIHEDGTAAFDNRPENYSEYESVTLDLCDKYDITLVDMSDTFMADYNESYILPHGFCNTAVESGHLNASGHQQIARELAKTVENLEGGAK